MVYADVWWRIEMSNFILDLGDEAFFNATCSAFSKRGVDWTTVDDQLPRQSANPERYLIISASTNTCDVYSDEFEIFLRSNKFTKAFILVSSAPKFEITEKRNGAIKFVNVPVALEEKGQIVDFFLSLFLEQFLGKYVNLPCGDPETADLVDLLCRLAGSNASVLINGPTGTGKEVVARLLHAKSFRKDEPFIAVNCAAIPENMLESMLFGHEKGAFTGATQTRSGYFEVADGGTIFLDEVGELPLTTQVRLLRVLENGEFIKVGSSAVQKTNVRIVAATNVNMFEAIEKEKFREDLYYRLSTIEIHLPALRKRKEDIHLLFRKFASDFALKYKMPTIRLQDNAVKALIDYRWNGNIRQLRNVAEQISVLETSRMIDLQTLQTYLPTMGSNLPSVLGKDKPKSDFSTEREILYKVLFDMKSDLNDLKKLTMELMKNDTHGDVQKDNESLIQKIYNKDESLVSEKETEILSLPAKTEKEHPIEIVENKESDYSYIDAVEAEEETLSLHDKELELIKKSLERHKGKRKLAADELGISERTLYRKIKQYDL